MPHNSDIKTAIAANVVQISCIVTSISDKGLCVAEIYINNQSLIGLVRRVEEPQN
ncbi:hypothetical protein [Nostoc sp.]|uniref:hypothetical protein n=1 Tax=Nostoc sp. TaxID=1180 RepID=UPI002FF51C0F